MIIDKHLVPRQFRRRHPGIPARDGWRIISEAHHESFLQVKAFWKAMQPPPEPKRHTSPAVRHTAPYALVHNNENPS